LQSLPFQQPGRFYRGNLHTHTTRSDGGLSPGEVVARYRREGYDFLAITDHFLEAFGFPVVDTRGYRDERFTTLIGAELHGPKIAIGERWHILAVGLPLEFAPLGPTETGPQIAARAKEAGAFVGIAHPAWYSLTVEDALDLEAADAVEVYNQTCVTHNDRGDSWYLSDLLSARGKRLFAYAADDAHFKDRPDFCGGWVQVRAASLDPDALLTALKAGHFYSSQGPEIHEVAVENGKLRFACSPAAVVFLTGPGAKALAVRGREIRRGELPLDSFAGSYCRVTVLDETGKRAWTNPIWLD
jgi:predicted metal-dependent phosphoesterase TrpH